MILVAFAVFVEAVDDGVAESIDGYPDGAVGSIGVGESLRDGYGSKPAPKLASKTRRRRRRTGQARRRRRHAGQKPAPRPAKQAVPKPAPRPAPAASLPAAVASPPAAPAASPATVAVTVKPGVVQQTVMARVFGRRLKADGASFEKVPKTCNQGDDPDCGAPWHKTPKWHLNDAKAATKSTCTTYWAVIGAQVTPEAGSGRRRRGGQMLKHGLMAEEACWIKPMRLPLTPTLDGLRASPKIMKQKIPGTLTKGVRLRSRFHYHAQGSRRRGVALSGCMSSLCQKYKGPTEGHRGLRVPMPDMTYNHNGKALQLTKWEIRLASVSCDAMTKWVACQEAVDRRGRATLHTFDPPKTVCKVEKTCKGVTKYQVVWVNLGMNGQTIFGDQPVSTYRPKGGFKRKRMHTTGFISKKASKADKVATKFSRQVLNLPDAFVVWLQKLPQAGNAARATCQALCSAH